MGNHIFVAVGFGIIINVNSFLGSDSILRSHNMHGMHNISSTALAALYGQFEGPMQA